MTASYPNRAYFLHSRHPPAPTRWDTFSRERVDEKEKKSKKQAYQRAGLELQAPPHTRTRPEIRKLNVNSLTLTHSPIETKHVIKEELIIQFFFFCCLLHQTFASAKQTKESRVIFIYPADDKLFNPSFFMKRVFFRPNGISATRKALRRPFFKRFFTRLSYLCSVCDCRICILIDLNLCFFFYNQHS